MRDPRVVGRTAHELTDILFLTLCAVLCGMDDWESIESHGLTLGQLKTDEKSNEITAIPELIA
ncbi:MAG: hypothetical protein JWN70_7058, partial [Planctomycetaceae bacterium]|nr:hypothetical protein [Planctomycetaceae bacterium]